MLAQLRLIDYNSKADELMAFVRTIMNHRYFLLSLLSMGLVILIAHIVYQEDPKPKPSFDEVQKRCSNSEIFGVPLGSNIKVITKVKDDNFI